MAFNRRTKPTHKSHVVNIAVLGNKHIKKEILLDCMKNRMLVIISTIIFSSCSEIKTQSHQEKIPKENTVSKSNDFLEELLDLVIERKDNNMIELPNLYDSLTRKIVEDKFEKLKIAERLKKRGFLVIDWGRGNKPPCGTRIICLTLQKEDCICEVTKVYYQTMFDTLFEMHESINCLDSLSYFTNKRNNSKK